MTKFAIYVCPTGSLAEQIQRFVAEHREASTPHGGQGPAACCMLIDGFEEQSGAAPVYTRSLDRAYNRGLKSRPSPVVTLDGLVTKPDWCGLALTSPWLKQVMVNFACTVKSPTRKMPLRIQDELSLPLAYGADKKQAKAVVAQAKETIDWKMPTQWEMRFYQQLTNQSWKCHSSWDLGAGQPSAS
ncbi:hypothetical protein IQ254_20975 [Nodosilinea sp. LEGE 07088]|uniref:hypothetical protein n=1 Tax=Nodosilinea sp. LEGE 07088 TaxID=2777968 RepID=UPI00188019DC|nr:hypothetical protein [Nodosilinea sp. LEGE 07088]MBE9139640.1 hypothetical protein [Nodosilinea sp. LEGE 07088]